MDSVGTSRQSATYHLTRDGWVVGDYPPPARIESWNCVVERAGRSKRYVEWTCLWADPETSQMERDRLRQKFRESVPAFRETAA